MTYSEIFYEYLADGHPEDAAQLVLSAPDGSARDGILALIYHEGMGVEANLGKSFAHALKAAQGGDGTGYFMLGYMCDHGEIPQDSSLQNLDAKKYYELCSHTECRWRKEAVVWLGDYYMDSDEGDSPATALKYYESVAGSYGKAAARLSDYYWDLINPENPSEDQQTAKRLFKWTSAAARQVTEEYAYRLGTLYACGVGCKKNPDKAIGLYTEAYEDGDWRGAQAIAAMMIEFLENNPSLPPEEYEKAEANIELCLKLAEEMRGEKN